MSFETLLKLANEFESKGETLLAQMTIKLMLLKIQEKRKEH